MLNKLGLIILYWIKFLIRNWKKKSKKGLLKRLTNIEDKNKNPSSNNVSFNSEKVYNKIEKQNKKINYRRFVLVGSGRLRYDISQLLNV